MSSKKFFRIIAGYLLLFVLYNGVVWHCCTKAMRTPWKYGIGDLARLGYMPWVRSSLGPPLPLSRRHLEIEEYHGQHVDMLTMGDSFSNGAGARDYYQDYIASYNNLSVLNIEPVQKIDFVTQLSLLINNGFIDRVKPRYVLISSSEKFCIERFSADVDFGLTIPMAKLETMEKFGYRRGDNPDIESHPTLQGLMQFINEGNFRLLLYTLYYHFSDHAFFGKVYRMPLTVPLFSGTYGTTLLFYRDDIRNIALSLPDAVRKVNDNLNRLADRLALQGITLVFMPVVDKYNLYRPYLVGNRYPENPFFEYLRPLPKRYILVDTKALLAERVRAGEKDTYLVGDTHWSWKAPQALFESVRFP